MSEETVICPVCKHSQGVETHLINHPMARYQCPVCGEYVMPRFVPEVHGDKSPNRKLSAWIREQNERREQVAFTKEGMIKTIVASVPDYRPSEKQVKLLKAIERRSGYPGQEATLKLDFDFPLAYAKDSDEFSFYLQALKERGLISLKAQDHADILDYMFDATRSVKVTPDGWDYLDRHASDLEMKTQGFVAMSFSDEMRPMWTDAIEPAIRHAGYTAYRVGEEPHSDNIIFRIMAEIKNSRFVVADVTEQKNGVYFEAGYALGLGLPVIWCVRKDDAKNVHFDTAQYNQIRWKSPQELQEGLFDYICAIIGKRSQAQE